MKKLFAWLTKKSKIIRVIRYLYHGIYVCNHTLKAAEDALAAACKPDMSDKTFEKVCNILNSVQSYLTDAQNILAKVLEWVGGEELVEAEEERAIAEITAPIENGESTRSAEIANDGVVYASTLNMLTRISNNMHNTIEPEWR